MAEKIIKKKKRIRKVQYRKLPVTAKCSICLETKAWRDGVACFHTRTVSKDHWICSPCFVTHCKNQNEFPFKCVVPTCDRKYTDSEILHLSSRIDEKVQSRWTRNALLKEMDQKTSAWNCPGCSSIFILDTDFKGQNIRCMNPECKRLYCKDCKEPAHFGKTCEEVLKRKQEMTKDDFVMDQVKKQVNLIKCPNPQCVDRPALFRSQMCNTMTCPGCKWKICGNCGDHLVDDNHFCDDPEECTLPHKHCLRFPHTSQDLDVLECGEGSCGPPPARKIEKKVLPAPRTNFLRHVLAMAAIHETLNRQPPVTTEQRDVPAHVSDEDYAAMLSIMNPYEIRRQFQGRLY